MTGELLAVAGGKGGCGKTTTTLGLVRAAARRGLDALAVDADVGMPNLHRMAGVDRRPGLDDGPPREVQQGAGKGEPVDGHAGVGGDPGVVAAPTDDGVTAVALSRCRRAADLALVDCPAGAGRDAATPLRTADRALVVTTPAPACLRDAARTAAMARALGTPVAGAVVSRADAPPAGVESLLDASVLAAVPVAASPLASPAVRTAHDRTLAALGVGSQPAGQRPE